MMLYNFAIYLLWLVGSVRLNFAHSCPSKINDPSYPCTKIDKWSDLVMATKTNANTIVLCPFTIEKPSTANSLLVFKSLTLICRDDGKCIINMSAFERNGVVKINEPGQLSLRGFQFQSRGSLFNMVSAIHVKFATSKEQQFCWCSFSG